MRRLLALILLCVTTIALATIPANLRLTLGVNSDNTVDTRYPAGDKISPSVLACDFTGFPSLVNLQTGSAFSSSARAKFSGSAAATATLSVVTVSGTDAATAGWSISGDNLVNPVTTVNSGVLRVRGTTGGIPVDCAAANWSIIAPGGTDSTAPTIPTGLTATGGSGNVTVTWDASSDPFVTQAGSGVTQYELRLGGSVVTTLTSQAHGLSPSLAQSIIGASDGTPSSTQTGANWSLSFGGEGLLSTADQFIYRAASIAGNAFSVVKVTSLTTATTQATTGLMARESTAVGSAYVACRYRKDGFVGIRARATTGAAASSPTLTASPALPVWLKLERVGNVWTCSYSADGGPWIPTGAPLTQAMSTTLLRGVFLASATAGTNAVAALDQLNLNNVATISSVHSTTVGGSYTVHVGDVAANNSAYSVAVVGTPSGGTDAAPPTYVTQPSISAPSSSVINANLGTCSDPSGVATYTPGTATSQGGTYTDQTPQASNIYSFTGLSAGATRCIKSKCTDTIGNTTAQTTPGVCTTTPGSGGTLEFTELWNTVYSPYPQGKPDYPSTWGSVGDPGCTSTSRVIDSAQSREGATSFRSYQDPSTPNSSHCMIVMNSGGVRPFTPGVAWWVGFSLRLASPWPADTGPGSPYLILWQFHGNNSGTANNPPVNIDAYRGAGNPFEINVKGVVGANKPYARSVQYTSCGNIVTNQWIDWVIKYIPGNASTGRLQVYRDGSSTPCVDDTGINYFTADTAGPYTSFGLYHGWAGGTPTPERRVYFDTWRIGREPNCGTSAQCRDLVTPP